MHSIASLAVALQHVLTSVADEYAAATGCVRRRRQFSGATLVQTLVFGYLGRPDASLSELAQTAASLGVTVSPQALAQRFTHHLAATLEGCLAAAVGMLVAADPVAIPVLARFTGVYLLDSTVIHLPDALATVWPGCGGRTGRGTQARLKLHVGLDLLSGRLVGPALTDGRVHDRRGQVGPLPPGSLRLADLGYWCLAELAQLRRDGVHWLTRLKSQPHLVLPDDTTVALADYLRQCHHQRAWEVDVAVRLGVRERVEARLLAQRVPRAVAQERRRRLRHAARREGRIPSAGRLALCDWVVLVTDLPAERLRLDEAVALARARWQIELLFKLWKTQGQVETVRSSRPVQVLCVVYAKLLALVIQHWALVRGCWAAPNRSLVQAAATVRRFALVLALAIGRLTHLVQALTQLDQTLAAGCRMTRRRAKPRTWQLLLNLEHDDHHTDAADDLPLAA
jgi:hypothetical protein